MNAKLNHEWSRRPKKAVSLESCTSFFSPNVDVMCLSSSVLLEKKKKRKENSSPE